LLSLPFADQTLPTTNNKVLQFGIFSIYNLRRCHQKKECEKY
jgi:hypothetical protein